MQDKSAPPPPFARVRVWALAWIAAWTYGACSPAEVQPDFGEALLVVDTNLPVPGVVSRLRVDVLAPSGQPMASRDVPTASDRQWPVSFSIVGNGAAENLVRLRAYLDGRTLARSPINIDAGGDFGAYSDSAESAVPDPALAIDRLLRIKLSKGVRGRIRVTLDGACAGVPAELRRNGRPRTCIDGETLSADVIEVPVEQGAYAYALPTAAGTYQHSPCANTAPADRVCHPGGAFLFGDAYFQSSRTTFPTQTPRPERLLVVSRFEMDRDEFSVGRYRAALARGFVPPTEVGRWDAQFSDDSQRLDACSFSGSPMDREDFGLSCVTFQTARALCQFDGGDLPSEAEWEYAALVAGRDAKALYPWGPTDPTCSDVVYGRVRAPDTCWELGIGASVDVGERDMTPLGVRALAGRLTEFVRDNPADLRDPCWLTNGSVDPVCIIQASPGCEIPGRTECIRDPGLNHSLRGGSWLSSHDELRPVDRSQATASPTLSHNSIGFRCVYRTELP